MIPSLTFGQKEKTLSSLVQLNKAATFTQVQNVYPGTIALDEFVRDINALRQDHLADILPGLPPRFFATTDGFSTQRQPVKNSPNTKGHQD